VELFAGTERVSPVMSSVVGLIKPLKRWTRRSLSSSSSNRAFELTLPKLRTFLLRQKDRRRDLGSTNISDNFVWN